VVIQGVQLFGPVFVYPESVHSFTRFFSLLKIFRIYWFETRINKF